MQQHRRLAAVGLLVLMAAAAVMAAPEPQEPLAGPSAASGSRKLLQYNWGRRRNGWSTGDAQLARNSAAIVNTQYAIRSAVESGADPGVTRAAALYGNDQAWLATQRWPNYGRGAWGGWYGRRRA